MSHSARRLTLVGGVILALATITLVWLVPRDPTPIRRHPSATFLVQPGQTTTFKRGDVLPGDVIECKDLPPDAAMVVPQPGFEKEVAETGSSVATLWNGSVVATCPVRFAPSL